MNERTKEFAGKALDKAVPYTWTQLDYDQIQELLACHTELIVRECIEVIEGGRFLHDQAPTAIFARECSGAIKRHFGVEE
jgi:hypothetical protein